MLNDTGQAMVTAGQWVESLMKKPGVEHLNECEFIYITGRIIKQRTVICYCLLTFSLFSSCSSFLAF